MAQKLPSGKYRQRVRYLDERTGKTTQLSFTADTAAEADYMALEFSLKKKRLSDKASLLLDEAVSMYIDQSRDSLSPSTVNAYEKIKRLYLAPLLHYRMDELRSEHLTMWIRNMSRTLSPKTISNAYGLLTVVYGVYMPDVRFNVKLPSKRKPKIQIPQKEDVARLYDKAKGTTMELPLYLAAEAGLRRSEIAALDKWDARIDMECRRIHVSEAVVKGPDKRWHKKATKTAAGDRWVNMTDNIYNYLLAADKKKAPVQICPDTITKNFILYCKDLGLDANFHLLRHYFCSVCISLNIPITYIVELMGHASQNMVQKVYGHMLHEKEQEDRQKLLDYFSVS